MKNLHGLLCLVSCIVFWGSGCNSPNNPPLPPSGITIVAPKGGEVFKTTDTVKIIRTCNYADFSSGTYTECSLDSSKTWDAIKALPPKTGIATDTLPWFPSEVYPDSLLIGKGILVRVRDYGNKFIAKSGYFFFTIQ